MTTKKKVKNKGGMPFQGLTRRATVQLTDNEIKSVREEASKQGRTVPGQIRFMMYGEAK